MNISKEDFINKYGNITVKFARYYKYCFTYGAVLPNGDKISVTFGGDSSDIYREEVISDEERLVSDLDPFSGVVLDANNKELTSFYDY